MAGLATAGVVGTLAAPAAAAPGATAVGTAAPAADEGGTPSEGDPRSEKRSSAPGAGHASGVLTDPSDVADRLAQGLLGQARFHKVQAAEEAARKAAERAERQREREREARAERAAERAALQRYVAPVAGSYVSTPYGVGGGMWSSGTHTGIDFHAPHGTVVRSVAAGEVVEAGWSGSYGYSVVVRHADGRYTQYGHLSSVTVAVGAQVSAGQQIGLAGSTGNSSGPHLHFEVRSSPDYGSDLSPLDYLRAHGVDV